MTSETEGLAPPQDQPLNRHTTRSGTSVTGTADTAADHGATPHTWYALLRRARIGKARKEFAFVVGSYASSNGRDIRCGIARLAIDAEIGYSTARRYLAWMRDAGLIELVRAGNRKAQRADEYRLTIQTVTAEHLDVPDMDAYRDLIDDLNDANRSGEKSRRVRDLRSPIESADTTEPDELSALTQESAEQLYLRSLSGPSALAQASPHRTDTTEQLQAPTTGGAPPPDPRGPRTAPPHGNDEQKSPTEPPTPAQTPPSDPLPRTRPRAPTGVVVELFPKKPRTPSPWVQRVTAATAAAAAAQAQRDLERLTADERQHRKDTAT